MEQDTVGTAVLSLSRSLTLSLSPLFPPLLPHFSFSTPRHGVGLSFETPKDGIDNDGVFDPLFPKGCKINGVSS